MHADTDARDSLACHLMKRLRLLVDAHVLDWISRKPIRRGMVLRATGWKLSADEFLCRSAYRNSANLGSCCSTNRRMGCSNVLVDHKEGNALASPSNSANSNSTSAKRRAFQRTFPLTRHLSRCMFVAVAELRLSATGIIAQHGGLVFSTERMLEVSQVGRVAAQSPQAQANRAETQRRNAIAQHAWKNSSGLTEQTYDQEIQPGLSKLSISAIATALGVSLVIRCRYSQREAPSACTALGKLGASRWTSEIRLPS